MRKAPARWKDFCRLVVLAIGLAALTFGSAIAQTLTGNRFEGTLTVVWGDPRPGEPGGEIRFSLTLPNGTVVPLQIDPAQQNAAIRDIGKRVVVQGSVRSDAQGVSRIAVDQLRSAVPEGIQQPNLVSGTRRVLFLLLRFKGDSQQPHPASFYLALTNPLTPSGSIPATLNGFFKQTSWGKLLWKADVGGVGGLKATAWLTLPYPKSHYANCGWTSSCANLNAIATDALKLAVNAGINLSVYNNINFVLNNDLDCCAWGGSIVYNNKVYGATWEPPWGQETGTYAHELGHSIGLPHSGWAYYAYDSPWDVMSMRTSGKTLQCGTYFSVNSSATRAINCTEPGDGYIAPHKAYLGWLPAANMVVVNKPMSVTVTLQADALPLGTAKKMIKICLAGAACTGSTAHYLTVEARLRGTVYDRGLTGDGVIIHDFRANRAPIGGICFFNNQSGWAIPIDATPGDYNKAGCNSGNRTWPNYALGNAQFVPGKTYSNAALHVSVAVLKKSGSAYIVKVTRTQ